MPKTASRVAVYCIVAIALGLTSLAFLPELFKKKSFRFEATSLDQPSFTFPLNKPLPLLGLTPSKTVKKVALAQLFQGRKTLLVNFWATWCAPCVEELPSLEYLHRQLSAKTGADLPGLVTISVDETEGVIFNLYKSLDFRPSFPVLHDKDADLARSVGTIKFPETYWIDASGKVLYKWIGPQNWLSAEVIRKLQEKS